ncbi:MAG: TetR/AcrR family transcriptional regulator [Candidatus Coproplasma sp.]
MRGIEVYHERRKNKLNIFVRECIREALFALMKEKPFDKITITEIITRSGVSRMGFYRNYESKESVIEDYILTVFENTVAKIEEERPLDLSTYRIIVTALENFKTHADYIKLFLDQKLDLLLLNCYKKAYYSLCPEKHESEMRYFYNELFIANLFSLECAWVRAGMKQSPHRLAKIYSQILQIQSRI